MAKVPIPSTDEKTKAQLIDLAKKAGKTGDSELTTIEKEINNIVYSLFDLTLDETKIVDKTNVKVGEVD